MTKYIFECSLFPSCIFVQVNTDYDSCFVFENDFPALQPDSPDPGKYHFLSYTDTVKRHIIYHKLFLSLSFFFFSSVISFVVFGLPKTVIKQRSYHFSASYFQFPLQQFQRCFPVTISWYVRSGVTSVAQTKVLIDNWHCTHLTMHI